MVCIAVSLYVSEDAMNLELTPAINEYENEYITAE